MPAIDALKPRYAFKPPENRFKSWHIGRNRLDLVARVISMTPDEILAEVVECDDSEYLNKILVLEQKTTLLRKAPQTLVAMIEVGSFLVIATEHHDYLRNSYVSVLRDVRKEPVATEGDSQ